MAVVTTITSELSKSQRSFLNIAVKAAEASELHQKHGAVVVKSGRVMSIGINKKRNEDMIRAAKVYSAHFTVHAEVDALSRVADAHGATLYIARVNQNGEERYSRPCDNCDKALRAAGIKTVIYTTNPEEF